MEEPEWLAVAGVILLLLLLSAVFNVTVVLATKVRHRET
jgi:hypothetical protein